jgi:UPF0716 protein FxsA
MMRLFLLFTLVPALELYLLLQVGSLMGPLPTLLLILVTGAVGAALSRREGLSVLQQLNADMERGLPPASRVVEGALIVAGGLLLVTPGMLTDVVGFSLVFPVTRQLLAPRVVATLADMGRKGNFQVHLGHTQAYPPEETTPPPRDFPFDHPVA